MLNPLQAGACESHTLNEGFSGNQKKKRKEKAIFSLSRKILHLVLGSLRTSADIVGAAAGGKVSVVE